MKAAELDLNHLLSFEPRGGVLRFAGHRALLVDAAALGLLRRQLADLLGLTAARGVLTRFGFAHGWRVAEQAREMFDWDSPHEWRIAGGRLHRLYGHVGFEPLRASERAAEPRERFACARWHDSYEAEQHLVHFGRAEQPVCWTLTGFASGYLSRAYQREIYGVERSCAACGEALCTMEARERGDWGDELADQIAYYQRDCLEDDLRALSAALRRADRRLRRTQIASGLDDGDEDAALGVVARSPSMRAVLATARRAAAFDTTVLIEGESGVGKERIARLIHARSPRAEGPFIAVNCGALPETLLESELFGHVRGAFTGASRDRAGLFESARGGTLLLDEIGELPLSMQVALLRVLQEYEVRRVGESVARAVDVRVVAATNRDLSELAAAGSFREDLYYRLAVITLRVPPLRERREDVLPLARLLLAEIGTRLGREGASLSASAAQRLLRGRFRGNVRELSNTLERALVLCDDDELDSAAIDAAMHDLLAPAAPLRRRAGADASGVDGSGAELAVRTLADVERDAIEAALRHSGGNRARAARLLGIGEATLYRRLKRYRAP
ncbi:MAG: sigma-54-dependent Fis family transcriptional regulator [Myxococcales bacterium]|nr:sigma-54-dependent Fis family transcriptional regulator [Myxococcales bacterium]